MEIKAKKADSFEKAAVLMLLSKGVVKLLGIISTLILVRIISPEDFGLVSISMAIYGFIELFGLFGFHSALIHKGNPTKQDYDVVFTFSALFGIGACLALLALSTPIAEHFNDLRIAETLKWVALMFFINGLKNIKTVTFQIEMNFSKELYFQIVPKIISFVITMALAFALRNYHALIYGMLVNSIVTVFISYQMVSYKPRFSLNGAGSLWGYSKWLMLNSFLQYLNNKAIDLLIGKWLSVRAVGLYSVSSELSYLPSSDICAPINKASFAAYAKVKEDLAQVKKIYEKNSAITNTITLPISVGFFVTSPFLVPVLLGPQWLETIKLIEIMSISCIVSILGSNPGYLLMALGRPKQVFTIAAFRTVIFLAATALLIESYGIYSAAWAALLSTSVSTCISIFYLRKCTTIGIKSLITTIWRPVLACVLMGLIVDGIQSNLGGLSQYMSFFLQVVVGVLVYPTALFVLWKSSGSPAGVEYDLQLKTRPIIVRILSRIKNDKKGD